MELTSLTRHRYVAFVLALWSLSSVGSLPAEGRDLSKLKPCEIVTGQEVARLAKGKIMSPPLGGPSGCSYLVELAGGSVESFRLFIQDPAMVEALWKMQTPEEKGERVPGLWDEAYLGKRPLSPGYSLLALRRGDMSIEITGERKDVLLAIAKLAIAKFP